MDEITPAERIINRIHVFRGKKVMVDRDLAELYGVTTAALNQAVRRNLSRFPEDFMFKLSRVETKNLISQIVISSVEHGGIRHQPLAFTEQGVAMLSSVLRSDRAIQVNIQIIRTFTKMREILLENDDLRRKIEVLEKQYDEQFKIVFDALRRMLGETDETENPIGFRLSFPTGPEAKTADGESAGRCATCCRSNRDPA